MARVAKRYPDGTRALADMRLGVGDGDVVVLVGPPGCGKTTTLRMVAGLEEITEGELRIGGRVVNHVPSRDRDIAMVVQSHALYPHLTVFDNIAFGLKLQKVGKDEIGRRDDLLPARAAARAADRRVAGWPCPSSSSGTSPRACWRAR